MNRFEYNIPENTLRYSERTEKRGQSGDARSVSSEQIAIGEDFEGRVWTYAQHIDQTNEQLAEDAENIPGEHGLHIRRRVQELRERTRKVTQRYLDRIGKMAVSSAQAVALSVNMGVAGAQDNEGHPAATVQEESVWTRSPVARGIIIENKSQEEWDAENLERLRSAAEPSVRNSIFRGISGDMFQDFILKMMNDSSFPTHVVKEGLSFAAETRPFFVVNFLQKGMLDRYDWKDTIAEETLGIITHSMRHIVEKNALLDKDSYGYRFSRAIIQSENGLFKAFPTRRSEVVNLVRSAIDTFKKSGAIEKRFEYYPSDELIDVEPNEIISQKNFPLNQEYMRKYFRTVNYKISDGGGVVHGDSIYSISEAAWERIFFDPGFQRVLRERAGDISYRNAFSLAQAVDIELTGGKLGNPEDYNDIEKTAREMLNRWDSLRSIELIGPNTNIIHMQHEDPVIIVDTLGVQKMVTDIVPEQHYFMRRGLDMENGKNRNKEAVLEAVRNINGPTTFIFSGHGSPEVWSFSENMSDNMRHSIDPKETGITYRELAESLVRSGNVDKVIFISDGCRANDFYRNLLAELAAKGSLMPMLLISQSSRKRLAFGDPMLENIPQRLIGDLRKTPVIFDDILRNEGWSEFNDPTFIAPRQDSSRKTPWVEIGTAEPTEIYEKADA